jgi:hypothetical protein
MPPAKPSTGQDFLQTLNIVLDEARVLYSLAVDDLLRFEQGERPTPDESEVRWTKLNTVPGPIDRLQTLPHIPTDPPGC